MEIILVALFFYIIINILISNNYIKLTKFEISDKKIGKDLNGFKIIHLSDLHGELSRKSKRIIKIIKKAKPDVIFLTGDMLDKKDRKFDLYINFLNELNSICTVYMVNGNNEPMIPFSIYKQLENSITSTNTIIIHNKKIKISKGSDILNLYGLKYKFNYNKDKEYEENKIYIKKSIGEINTNEYNIVLVHDPIMFDVLSKYGIDLVFSGHIHGGIIKIFNQGLLSPDRKFFPKYTSGVYEWNDKKLVLNSGLSISPLYFRINNSLEITQVTLINKI